MNKKNLVNNISFFAFSLSQGGAAIAANRIKDALIKFGIEIDCYVVDDVTGLKKLSHLSLRVISHALGRIFNYSYKNKVSLNIFSSTAAVSLINSKSSLLHVHWVNNDSISIKKMKELTITHTCLVTLHDEWLYCGNEHYAEERFKHYTNIIDKKFSIPFSSDHTFKRKMKYLSDASFEITVPSTWMKSRVEHSALLSNKKVHVVGNAVPVDIFSPNLPNSLTREELGISDSDIVVLFGAVGGGSNPLKGADLLIRALKLLDETLPQSKKNKVRLVAFGGEFDGSDIPNFDVIKVGHVKSQESMANLYRLADLTIVPSRAEAFGQVAAESCACGTPVVAFNYSGLKDIIINNYNGYLAEPFCPRNLAECIVKFISLEKPQLDLMSKNSVKYINEKFNPAKIASDFNGIYQKLI
ncbi:glycosyltransferase [Pseudoalteromonas sp. BSi20429]|uniref:glycosyltransferase n=1 Tax=Pseudoalteromonas sp. BSi20429 TaxID=1097676 RepID=UPI00023177DB|nr:glycosyltransferase [Pseudoalteromonas sp. BSi20429]GAA68727.1 UDP-N-acetylglucosamine:(glucosyl)LPS alpha-1,2-N-acetylglucosaminyltransferase [Pseudoalteromonas sp. BSi20429]